MTAVNDPVMLGPGSASATVELRDVVAGYYADLPVLHGLSLTCESGRVTALLGPNGAGKSTALRVIAGLMRPFSGQVLLFGEDVTGLTSHELVRLGMAFLPQGRSIFAELTVGENLELGAWSLPRKQRKAAVEKIYERYPLLKDKRKDRSASLSGGQQRLLEISRALVAEPKVVVVDEPSVGLSPVLAERSYEELVRLKSEARTVVLVDQNVRRAVALADYVYSLRGGRTEREGSGDVMATDLAGLAREWLGVEHAENELGAATNAVVAASPTDAQEQVR